MEKHYRSYLDQGHKLLGNSQLVLAELADKFDLYVVTNGVSKTQYRRLSDAKLMPLFSGYLCIRRYRLSKPMKEFFTYVLTGFLILNNKNSHYW